MFQSAVIRDEFAFTGHNAALTAVCYNRHLDCFVSADGSSLRLWRPNKQQQQQQQAQPQQRVVSLPPRTANFVQALEYIDSRQVYVASALDGTLKLFDASLSELTAVFTRRATILSLVFDAKRGRLLSGGIDGCAAWQVRGKPPSAGGNATTASDAGINPNYELAPLPGFFHGHQQSVAHGPSRTTKRTHSIIDTDASSSSGSTNNTAWVRSIQLNADASRLFAQSARHIDVFAAADGAFVERHADLFPDEYGALSAFALHERSQYLVCGTSAGAIFILSLHPTAVVHVFKDHTAAVTSLAVLAASGLVLSSSLDGSVRLWDLEARRQVHRLDLGQAVQDLQLLAAGASGTSSSSSQTTAPPAQSQQSLRFYCRVRSAVRIFRIQSTIKEHMACLAPISILLRVPIPRVRPSPATSKQEAGAISPGLSQSASPAATTRSSARPTRLATRPVARLGRSVRHDDDPEEDSEASDESDGSRSSSDEDSDAPGSADAGTRQVIVAAGTDKTIRLFAGRAANEAPSFTWIPEEDALDLVGFALHPNARRLLLLLDSQKLLVVSTTVPTGGEQTDVKGSAIERVVSFNGYLPPSSAKLSKDSTSSVPEASRVDGDSSQPAGARRASVFRSSNLPAQLVSSSARRPSSVVFGGSSSSSNSSNSGSGSSSGGGRRHRHASVASVSTPTASSTEPRRAYRPSGSMSAAASQRGKLCSLCVCFFPPIFHASFTGGASASVTGPTEPGEALAPATQTKWLSRTLTLKRQASTLAQETRKQDASPSPSSDCEPPGRERRRSRPQRLVKSEWEWVACGSEFGHLLFWHTGLDDSDADAISIDAHDAAVVSLSASQSSALLVSLDAGHRVHLWHLQPVLALRHLLDLRDKPSCFALSPRSELLLAGFDDGRVTLTDASDLAHVETFPFPFRGDQSVELDDQQHSAMVSAGDFLDEKRIVLTVSVDAVVKVWDQRRNLLRQVAVSSALTSLCFMNKSGDVMAGLHAGIFVLSRHDVLPEKLLRGDRRRGNSRESRRKRGRQARDEKRPVEDTQQPSTPTGQATNRPSVASRGGETRESAEEKPLPAKQEQPESRQSQQPVETPVLTPLAGRRRQLLPSANADSLISRINDRPLAATSLLHAPVLRSLNVGKSVAAGVPHSHQQPALATSKDDELGRPRATDGLPSPIGVPSRDEDLPDEDGGGCDHDWRDSLLPVSPWRQLLNRQHGNSSPLSPCSQSPSRRRPASRQALPPSHPSPLSQLDSVDAPTPLSLGSRRSDDPPSTLSPSGGLSVGSWDDDRPVLYCKHQAPVPPKDKTPRKLWNAIGGEDRRLLALQRNLLPPC